MNLRFYAGIILPLLESKKSSKEGPWKQGFPKAFSVVQCSLTCKGTVMNRKMQAHS